MKRLISLPMSGQILAEYGGPAGLETACRALACDGLEVVWAGEELPRDVPPSLHAGYHLTFFPDWLDFWRGDRQVLEEKFGREEVWRSFYGGMEGPETLLRLYRQDLDRALAWGAEYVVFHVSDVSVEEGILTDGATAIGRSSTLRWRRSMRFWTAGQRGLPFWWRISGGLALPLLIRNSPPGCWRASVTPTKGFSWTLAT